MINCALWVVHRKNPTLQIDAESALKGVVLWVVRSAGRLVPCFRDMVLTCHVLPQIFFRRFSAYVHYPDDDTYEELELKELIKNKHIAISKCW